MKKFFALMLVLALSLTLLCSCADPGSTAGPVQIEDLEWQMLYGKREKDSSYPTIYGVDDAPVNKYSATYVPMTLVASDGVLQIKSSETDEILASGTYTEINDERIFDYELLIDEKIFYVCLIMSGELPTTVGDRTFDATAHGMYALKFYNEDCSYQIIFAASK